MRNTRQSYCVRYIRLVGFEIGLSGSWLLFTGLVGAWLAAVVCTDSVQWMILFIGLIGLGLPLGYRASARPRCWWDRSSHPDGRRPPEADEKA